MRLAPAALFVVIASLSCPALADPPPWAKGKGKGHDAGEAHDDDRGKGKGKGKKRGHSAKRHFDDHHRVAVREYYGEYHRSGRCPPGLAKKNNGCMPPGQAKKYQIGQPLPAGVVYYEVPQPLLVRLGPPPSGYTYARVAGDIHLLTVGTMMVVDALTNIGQL